MWRDNLTWGEDRIAAELAKLGYSVDSRTVAKYRPSGAALGRRRIVHVGVTEHPTGAWTTQRLVEAIADADVAPRILVHDRDSIYGGDFTRRVRGLGTRVLVTQPRAPQADAFAERVIGTLRRDCLDHVIVWGERHAELVLKKYVAYCHGRSHRGLRMQPPDGARHLPPLRPHRGTPIVASPILGGLHHTYGFARRARATITVVVVFPAYGP